MMTAEAAIRVHEDLKWTSSSLAALSRQQPSAARGTREHTGRRLSARVGRRCFRSRRPSSRPPTGSRLGRLVAPRTVRVSFNGGGGGGGGGVGVSVPRGGAATRKAPIAQCRYPAIGPVALRAKTLLTAIIDDDDGDGDNDDVRERIGRRRRARSAAVRLSLPSADFVRCATSAHAYFFALL
uniref:Uncharacterized protein n=1 Tax=Plectus sambesii TaxID=2011161 RepID=A0A914VMX9_9BILA